MDAFHVLIVGLAMVVTLSVPVVVGLVITLTER